MRIFQIIHQTPSFEMARVIIIIGALLSLFVACVFMFKVHNYQRMLAYSSVEHLGLIALGMGIGGLAFIGAIYHAIYNSLTKIVLFLPQGTFIALTNPVRWIKSDRCYRGHQNRVALSHCFFCDFRNSSIRHFFSEIKIFEGILFSDKPYILAIVMFLLY